MLDTMKSASPSGIAGVIFDMDGVLADSELLMAKASVRMFREHHGVAVKEEDFVPFVGTGEIRYLGGVAQKYGVSLNQPADKDFAYQTYLDMIPGNLEPLNGAVEFVLRCRAEGMKTAVATGADRIKLDGTLNGIGLPPRDFDALVTGSDISRPKPDPEIFVTAARAIGIPPSRCLVIEDSIHGVAGALAGGSLCMALTTSFPREVMLGYRPQWIFRDLAQALEQWEQIFS